MAEVESSTGTRDTFLGSTDIENIDTTKLPEDGKLVLLINSWMRESTPFHEALKKVQDQNEQYYKGWQTKKGEIPKSQSDAVDNRIFVSVETIVPIVTSNPPQFVAQPAQETEASVKLANSVERMLMAQYDLVKAKDKLREGVRYMLNYRMGIWKIFWNEETNDVDFKAVRPQRLWIPPYGTSVDDLPYIIEKVDMSFEEIEDVFGADALKKVKGVAQPSEDDTNLISGVRTIWEVWTDDWVAWKYGSEILKKMPNPYWDWIGTQGDDEETLKFYNHFAFARKPYVIRSPFTLGNSVVGDTDLYQQAIPLQDLVNTHLRQITNCANRMGNPRILIDSEVMPEEKAGFITNAPGQVLWGNNIADQNKFRAEQPVPIPEYIVRNKNEALVEMDNVMGTHSTTRGERAETETLGGRILLKQQDYGRIGDVVGLLESAVAEIGNWFVQLFKMYYDREKTVKLYGPYGTEFVTLTRDNIEDGLEIIIKAGSTLPTDEIAKRNEALELWQMGAIDPITLFERLKFPNPQQAAERLVAWKQGQLVANQPLPEAQTGQPSQTAGAVRQPGNAPVMPGLEQEQANLMQREQSMSQMVGG